MIKSTQHHKNKNAINHRQQKIVATLFLCKEHHHYHNSILFQKNHRNVVAFTASINRFKEHLQIRKVRVQDLWISRRGRFGSASPDSVGITAVTFFDTKDEHVSSLFEHWLCHGNLCTSCDEQRRQR
jgi:hypothetical protein